ncbi:hypothetical protein BD626DRAFT_631785 [Schizophyllum amplum]|uniref:Uncharacterized protein n=1 Tax=Schizophyllum amplum TaxID=97359 RepID=A0A550C8V6_9AGAR|nr:hypothetical protein BD626DRAFT_631785 [Auriculariopsis ampla]
MPSDPDTIKDELKAILRDLLDPIGMSFKPVTTRSTHLLPFSLAGMVSVLYLKRHVKKETRLLDELDALLTVYIDTLNPEALAKLHRALQDAETQRDLLARDVKSFWGPSLYSILHAHKITKLCKGLLNEGRAAVNEAIEDAIANLLVLRAPAPRGSRTDVESIGTDGLSNHDKVQHRNMIFFGGDDASRSALLKAVRDASLTVVALENAVAPGVSLTVRDDEVIDMIYEVVSSETQADSSTGAPALLIYLHSDLSTLSGGGGVASSLGSSAADSATLANPEEAPVFHVHFVNGVDLQAGVAGDLSFITSDMTNAVVISFEVRADGTDELTGDAALTAQQVSEMINSVSLEQFNEDGVDEISRLIQDMTANEATGHSDKDVAAGEHV